MSFAALMPSLTAHDYMEWGFVPRNLCHRELCQCKKNYFCTDEASECGECRMNNKIRVTLKTEFDVEISEAQAAEGVQLYVDNLGRFYRWVGKIHPWAPLAFAPEVA
jgi:hypothetical protein